MICQTCPQTRRVQNRTRTEYVLRIQTGNLNGFISQNINRIAYNDVASIRCILCNFRHNRCHNLCIGLAQVNSGLTRLSCDTNGDDNQIGIDCICIIAIPHVNCRTKCSTLHNIHCFTLCLRLIDIYQQQFRTKSLNCKGKCDGSTNITSTNDGYFFSLFHEIHFSYPPNTE